MPRFTGRQSPGAMKDHRARLREEAEARQSPGHPAAKTDLSDALTTLGTIVAAPFMALADAAVALCKALTGAREQTQDDFALVPDSSPAFVLPVEQHYFEGQPLPLFDNGGVLPGGVTRMTKTDGEPEYIYTRKEWEYIHGLGKMPEADQ